MSIAARDSIDPAILANLSPLNTMDIDHFNEVASRAKIKQFKKGEYLFREGHSDRHTFYVIKGRIALLSQANEVKTINSDDVDALEPIAPDLPRKYTARVQATSTVVMIDTTVLDFHLGKHNSETYQVNEIDNGSDGDWMTKILQSEAFSKLPPINLQRMLSGVTEVSYQSGDTVINEGQNTDHYFIVKSGVCCNVNALTQEWRCGDAFGASGLMLGSGQPATIIMKSSGELMLLPKEDFIELCYTPLVKNIDQKEADKHIDSGACWLDLRSQSLTNSMFSNDCTSMDFSELHDKVKTLDKSKTYVVMGDSDLHAGIGSFVLMQHGMDAYCFSDGTPSLDTSKNEITNLSDFSDSPELTSLELETNDQPEAVNASLEQESKPKLNKLGGNLSLVDYDAESNIDISADLAEQPSIIEKDTNAEKVSELNSLNEKLNSKLTSLETEVSALNAKLSSETENRKNAESTHTDFLKKVQRYKRGNDALVKKLKTQLVLAKNKLRNLLAQSASVDTDISEARAEIEQKANALAMSEQKLAKEQQNVTELQATITDLRNQLDHVGQEFAASQDADKVKLLQEKIKSSAEEKRALEEELKSLREDYEALENERAEAALWEEMEDLQNALESGDVEDDLSDLSDMLDDDDSDELSDIDID